jgi:ZIP family zinc transporter
MDQKPEHDQEASVSRAFLLCLLLSLSSVVTSFFPYLDFVFSKLKLPYRIANNKEFHSFMFSFGAGVLLFLSLSDLLPEAVKEFEKLSSAEDTWARPVAAVLYIVPFVIKSIRRLFGRTHHDHKFVRAEELHVQKLHKSRSIQLDEIDQLEAALDPQSSNSLSVSGSSFLPGTPRSAYQRELSSLSMQVALGLALHNFPEGFATFQLVVREPVSSPMPILFCLGIFLHKIPEGILIALPIWMESGSRLKGVVVAALAGSISFFIGGSLGYIVYLFQDSIGASNVVFNGVLFALVAGFLADIAVTGMVPLAYQCDPSGRHASYPLFLGIGMFVILNSFVSE